MDNARLVWRNPNGTRTWRTLKGRTSIGRAQDCTICLLHAMISKYHATVEPTNEGWRVSDLKSRNGVSVNNKRLTEPWKLENGDRIQIGPIELHFEVIDDEWKLEETVKFKKKLAQQHVVASLSFVQESHFKPVEHMEDPSDLGQDYEKLRIAHDFSRQLSTSLTLDNLIETLLTFCFKVFPADNGVVMLVDQASDELKPKAVKKAVDNRAPVMVSRNILSKVRDTKAGLLINDTSRDNQLASAKSIQMAGMRAILAVPLLNKDKVRGVLCIDNCTEVDVFHEKDLKLLLGIAHQASMAMERMDLIVQIEKEAETRANLSRFLSPALVDQVQAGEVEIRQGGAVLPVAILYSDIRGYTNLSEQLGPIETVELLNDYYERMVESVFEHGGVLDKFIGDALLAVWGAPFGSPNQNEKAIRCALDMQIRIAQFNKERSAKNLDPIHAGIGVNAGPALVGFIGSSQRLEYTVIGDTVNLAARLCGLAKEEEVLVENGTLSPWAALFDAQAKPLTKVKGKSEPISFSRVLGLATQGVDDAQTVGINIKDLKNLKDHP